MRRFVLARAAVALAALALLLGAPAGAGAAAPRASLPDIENEVMCVVCNVPLAIAGDAPQAVDERGYIEGLIARGLDKGQIKAALVLQYGSAVLADPGTSGIGLAAYLVPPVLLVLAVVLLFVLLPRWRRRSPAPAPSGAGGAPLEAADARRLEEDLARFDA